jgi:Tol biopolymer transport system component
MGSSAEASSENGQIVFVNASDGTVRSAVKVSAAPSGLEWIDSSSIVFSGEGGQLWRLSYPDGTRTRVTNDLSAYRGVSVGSDRNTLVTARSESHAVLWIGTDAAAPGTEIEHPMNGGGGDNALVWNVDRLVFNAQAPTYAAIYALPPNGGQPEEILKNAQAAAFTSDGKTMVYDGADGSGVWKADSDGRNPIQLVHGRTWWPVITSDDKNVLYESFAGGVLQIWTVPLSGGKSRLVSPVQAAHPDISPDGKSLLFASQEQNQWFISICDLPDCSAVRHVRPMNVRLFMIRWMPDGRAIAYAPAGAPGANITIHPLDGAPESQLTHFKDNRSIGDFAWSRDGKHFAVARGSSSQDIVLFRGIKPDKP